MNDTLSRLFDLATKVRAVIDDRNVVSLQGAFDHPDVVALRNSILETLGYANGAAGLIDAVKALDREFNRLHALPYSEENMPIIGKVAATKRLLSIQALEEASEPLQIFAFTVGELWPYLEGLWKAGVLVAGAVA